MMGDGESNGNGYRALHYRMDRAERDIEKIDKDKADSGDLASLRADFTSFRSNIWYIVAAVMLMVITTVLVKTGVVLQ